MPTSDLAAASVWVRGGRRLWALLPSVRVRQLSGWRLLFAALLPAARLACMGRVTALTDDACVPVCPLAFQPSLASKTHLPPPSTRLTSLRCHERPISFHVNAGLTPAPRPSISAREMCGDPLHERRREPGAARFKMCAAHPVLHLPMPKPPPPMPRPGPTFGSTKSVLT